MEQLPLSQTNSDGVQVVGESVYLNQSRISSYLSCEELYHLQYEYQGGLTPKATELPLVTGSAYHAGISYYYHHNRDVEGAVTEAQKLHDERRAEGNILGDERPLWNIDKAIVELLIKTYHNKYHREPLQVLMPEASGVVRLGKSPHFLVFRTDAVYQEYNHIGLLEFKTKGRTPSGLEITRIHSDIQPTAYVYGVSKVTGLKVEGVKFRYAIKKPEYDINRLHLEEFTMRTPKDLQRFEDEVIWICERILANRKSNQWLHNWTQCTVFGECRMRRACLHHRDPAVITLYNPRKFDYVDEAKGGAKSDVPST